MYVETFNNIRDIKIFSNYLVTKTDPMELNKRHRHWNWSTTISLILCYTAWIIKKKRGMFISSWGIRVVYFQMYFQMKFRFNGYILDISKTQLNCHVLYFKLFIHVSIVCLYFVNTAVSCQLYSSTKLTLICFQNIAQMYMFMLKNISNFR